MAFRFRRSIKIAPGVKLNIGKRGFTSVSVGGKFLKTNVSGRGTRQTFSIPGIGLSHSRLVSGRRPVRASGTAGSEPRSLAPPVSDAELEAIGATRLPYPRPFTRRMVGGGVAIPAGLLLMVVSPAFLIVSVVGLILVVATPSRTAWMNAQELDLRSRVDDERRQRIGRFEAAYESILAPFGEADPLVVREVLALQQELGLADEDAGRRRLERLRDELRAGEITDTRLADGGFPAIPVVLPAQLTGPCFFNCAAFLTKRGLDEDGTCFFLHEELAFVGASGATTRLPWREVQATPTTNGLTVHVNNRKTPFEFSFSDRAHRHAAEAFASWLTSR